ncbi:hypothetical protein AVEN_30636-1 [Araneus ventricosus]|uniref:Secreted protein n=1 Tax=Araneus ventricosus TaxID=182803 RepID=A0A4Y2L5F4_ARAVE|nr:hypothetical protein AVEN_30636-1 [Araneus ventricosus]
MRILPALMYLKVLPLFGQCLNLVIVANKTRPPHAGGAAFSPLILSRPCTFMGRPGQCGHFCTTPAGGRLIPYCLAMDSETLRAFAYAELFSLQFGKVKNGIVIFTFS